jgi:hypothetical protein
MIGSRLSGNAGRITAALLAALVTATLYLFLLGSTMFAGGLRGTSELCPGKKLAPQIYTYSAFPLQNQCNFADGTTKSLIPYWKYNGILFGAITVTLVLLVVAAAGLSGKSAEVPSRRFLDSPGLLFAAGAGTAVSAVVGVVLLALVGLWGGPILLFAGLMLALTVFLISRSVQALAEHRAEHRRDRSAPDQPEVPPPYPTAWERS